MRYSTTVVVAALSIGQAVAGPTHAHLHRHRDAHEKRLDWGNLDWQHMGIDWSSAWAAGQHSSTVAPVPAPTSAPVAAAPPKSTAPAKSPASSSNLVSDVKTLFSDIKGLADDITSFGTPTSSSGSVVGKIGNIGNPQGSNMMKVDSAEGHQFTNTFINTSPSPITIAVWNKAFERDGNVEANLGSCVAPSTPALSITLKPGGHQIVAFQDDTQAGWAQATSAIAMSGAYATSWGEINYSSSGSGYDVSAIMNQAGNTYDMSISSAESPCISDMTQNLWVARNNNPEDPIPVGNSDGSCYIPGSTATIVTKMGGPV